MRPDTSLAVKASCESSGSPGSGGNATDVMARLTGDKDAETDIIMGGQQGVVTLRRGPFHMPDSVVKEGGYLRWTLLSPAVFPAVAAHPGGWLPTWVDPTSGLVMLPRHKVDRQPAETRNSWRKRVSEAPKFEAQLIAARIGKPMVFSGWDINPNPQESGPRPTLLAVPAGSAYIFECTSMEERDDLVEALSWNGGNGEDIRNRRSAVLGEKGYGLGVCSMVTPAQPRPVDER